MALTKNQIVDTVYERALRFNHPRAKTIETVETLLEIIKRSLKEGEDVLISGFGKFSVKEKQERKGRNPATGETMTLPPRKVVAFKCSGKLRNKINAGGGKRKKRRVVGFG